MKKALISFVAILVSVFVLLSVLGAKDQYAAERALWKINQRFSKVSEDPKIFPNSVFDELAKDYRKFTLQFSQPALVAVAHIFEGRVALLKEDYTGARNKFNEVIKLYASMPNVAAEASAEIAHTYALEDNYDKALETYRTILKDYPLTPIGLKIPILIVRFHQGRREVSLAQRAFKDAVIHYKVLIQENPDSGIELDALRLLAACYASHEQWDNAIDVFRGILLKFGGSSMLNPRIAKEIVTSINTIAVVKLKNYDMPAIIYDDFVAKYPQHPFNRVFQRIIASFKSLSEKQKKELLKNIDERS